MYYERVIDILKSLLKWFSNILLFLTSFLICAVVIELALRLFLPQQESMNWFATSGRYGHINKPDHLQYYNYPDGGVTIEIKTNSMGMRNPEIDLFRKNFLKILLLGDSYVFGYGVNQEDTFGAKLQHLINSELNFAPTYVLNAGVGGWGTSQEVLYLKDNYSLLSPDVVVLTFCGNDPHDDLMFSVGLRDNDKGLLQFPGKAFFKQHSHLYRFLFYKFSHFIHAMALKRKMDKVDASEWKLDQQTADLITEQDWNRTYKHFDRTVDFLSSKQHPPLIIQAANPLNDDIKEHLSQYAESREGVDYIDLSVEFAKWSEADLQLFYDGHWSPKAHQISANMLLIALKEHGLFDKPLHFKQLSKEEPLN